MRLFFACELPDLVRAALAASQAALRAEGLPVRWSEPQAMHLTLCFLGETAEALVGPLLDAAGAALCGAHAPLLTLAPAGTFPGVVWQGVGGQTRELLRLQGALAEALVPLGFPRERRAFRPHLTLGRLQRDAPPSAQMQIEHALRLLPAPRPTPWRAERVTLFSSQLRPSGPSYAALGGVALHGADS